MNGKQEEDPNADSFCDGVNWDSQYKPQFMRIDGDTRFFADIPDYIAAEDTTGLLRKLTEGEQMARPKRTREEKAARKRRRLKELKEPPQEPNNSSKLLNQKSENQQAPYEELWDKAMIEKCYKYAHRFKDDIPKDKENVWLEDEDVPPSNAARRVLAQMRYKKSTNGIVAVPMHYKLPPSGFGRLFATSHPSLQSCSGSVARLCAGGFYTELDMVNAGPRLLLQFAQKELWLTNLPYLQAYCYQREKCWEIVKYQLSNLQLNREKLKQLFIICYNRGDYRKEINGQECAYLHAFKEEMYSVADAIFKRETPMKAWVIQNPKKNPKGRVVAMQVMDLERQVIESAQRYLASVGVKVDVIKHDALWVRRINEGKIHVSSIVSLQNMRDWCFKETGYVIEWDLEDVKPTEDEWKLIADDEPPEQTPAFLRMLKPIHHASVCQDDNDALNEQTLLR